MKKAMFCDSNKTTTQYFLSMYLDIKKISIATGFVIYELKILI